MARGWNPLIGIGFTALGVGYLYEAYANRERQGGLGAAPAAGGGDGGRGGIKSYREYPVGDIDHRVSFIVGQIRKDSTDKDVITEARTILSGKCPVERGGSLEWCIKPKSWQDEITALFNAVTNPNSRMAVRYTRDHATVDLFGSSSLMRRLPAGDCDDMVIRLGALLRAVGYAVKARVVAPAGQPRQWSHIYLMVGDEPGNPSPSRWFALDPTEPQHPAGWEVPASLISTKKDFPV